MNQEQVLAGLLQRQRLVKSEMRTVNALIEEQPCSGCGQPLETSEPRGCEACEGRFCWRDGCLTAYNDGVDGTLHFCTAHAPTQPPAGHEGIEPGPLSSGQMQPRLICLTGPAAAEVAQVFRRGLESRRAHSATCPDSWAGPWDEVRAYMEAVSEIAGMAKDMAYTLRIEERIRSLPGGEAWLVGLVLPECPLSPDLRRSENWTPWQHAKVMRWGLPARLAILAPGRSEEEERRLGPETPSSLLLERVKAWGGEQWICSVRDEASQAGVCWIARPDGKTFWGHTWPEAIRSALGEA